MQRFELWRLFHSREAELAFAGFLFVSCLALVSQDHRGVGQDIVWSKPIPSRDRHSRLFWTMPWWVLNISRNGNSTASVDNLFQCSATLLLSVECPGIQLFWQN